MATPWDLVIIVTLGEEESNGRVLNTLITRQFLLEIQAEKIDL